MQWRWLWIVIVVSLVGLLLGYARDVDWERVVAQVRPAVVRVLTQTPRWTTCGSGVIVSPEGYILTAAHVLENARSIVVVVEGCRKYNALVVKIHDWTDLAILRIDAEGLVPLRFGNTTELDDGAEICVLGYPNCGTELVVAQGRVGRMDENSPMGMIWYDAPVQQGQSGGPVIDAAGRLVAVHFEHPAAEGGGRGVSAEVAMYMIPFGVPFIVSSAGAAVTVEWVSVSEPVEPGDVLETDLTRPGYYHKARGPCSRVAGAVFSKPGLVSNYDTDAEGKALLALLGIVPVKVTDEGGAIRPGDLLVVSSIPGYAKRWDPEEGTACGFVGKALEPYTGESGMVFTLLMGGDAWPASCAVIR